MDQKITLVLFNQRQGRIEVGEQINDYDRSILPNHHYTGGEVVEDIFYHTPSPNVADGDRHYVDINLKGGFERRIFDIDEIRWEPIK